VIRRRFKYFMPERNEFSTTGEETLLSVSEYYGVKPRSEAFDADAAEGRAASLEGYRKVKAGDFVMNYMLAWKGAYGVSDHDGIVSPAYAVYKINPKYADQRFIHHRLRSEHMRSVFRARSKGIIESRLRLYPDAFLSMELELPDLDTQKAIADFLDRETARIDQLIEKKQRLVVAQNFRLLSLLRGLVLGGATVQRGLSGNWLHNLPDGWTLTPLKHLVSVMGGATPSKEREDFWIGEIPWVSPKDMKSDVISEVTDHISEAALAGSPVQLVPVDAVLIVVRGMILARTVPVCRLGVPATINQDMKALLPWKNVISGDYLQRMLQGFEGILISFIEEAAHGTKKLRSEALFSLKFPVPPLHHQERICAQYEQARIRSVQLSAATVASIDRLREFRTALITAAVTGQIDVSTWGKSGEADRRLDQIEEDMALREARA